MYCFTGCGSARLRNLHPLNMQRRSQPGERGSGLAALMPYAYPSTFPPRDAKRPQTGRMQGKRPIRCILPIDFQIKDRTGQQFENMFPFLLQGVKHDTFQRAYTFDISKEENYVQRIEENQRIIRRITERWRRCVLSIVTDYVIMYTLIAIELGNELVHAEQREIGKPTISRRCKYHNYKLHIYFVRFSLSNNERTKIITATYRSRTVLMNTRDNKRNLVS